VRAVSGRSEEETVQALEESLAQGLLVERAADYDFTHDLLRVVVYEDLSLARRRLLHGRAADVLGSPSATTARHLHLAGREADAAVAYRAAGDLARSVYAHAEALEHLRSALALGHPDRTGLRIAIGDLLVVTGRYADALPVLEAAAAEAEPDRLAAVEQRLGRLQHRKGEFALAGAHLRAALGAVDDDTGRRAGITADLSLAAHAAGDGPSALRLAREAQDLADAAGDLPTLGRTQNLLGLLAAAAGDTDGALVNLAHARELAERLGDLELLVAVLNNLSLTHAGRDELDEAIDEGLAALDLCEATGDRHHEAALHNNLADLLHAAGRAEESMAHLKAGVGILAEIGAQEEPAAGIWKLVQW
jgi:tetratricopeptide (TPR) repeat protein